MAKLLSTELRGLDSLFEAIKQQSETTTLKYPDPDLRGGEEYQERVWKKQWYDRVHDRWDDRYKLDTMLRKWLAISTQILIFLWMAAVVVILMYNKCYFNLPSSVIIAILGTTTATVLGLAYIVLKGFFSVMNQDIPLNDK